MTSRAHTADQGQDDGRIGLGEELQVDANTGSAGLRVPVPVPEGRSGFGPQLALHHGGRQNGRFGIGWSLPTPALMRMGKSKFPTYRDHSEEDVFVLVGVGELVPLKVQSEGQRERVRQQAELGSESFDVYPYRPRQESAFARIERWVSHDSGETHWRSMSGEGTTAVFGRTGNARVADPSAPRRVHQWLLETRYDDHGNAERHEYVAENLTGVSHERLSEAHRTGRSVSAARHPWRIRYGNTKPYEASTESVPDENRWLFQVVFDYGDQDAGDPAASSRPQASWPVRPDPFSQYQAGFEVRTYRLCRRILVFHHMEELGPEPELIGSLKLNYDEGHQYARAGVRLAALSYSGSRPDGSGGRWVKRTPPLTFTYSEAEVEDEVRELGAAQIPGGLDGLRFRLVDLHGEGVQGILAERGTAWYYQEPLGDGAFGPLQAVQEKPASIPGRDQLTDVDLDGRLDLARYDGVAPGYHPSTSSQSVTSGFEAWGSRPLSGWEPFQSFDRAARVRFSDPHVQSRNLSGAGSGDLAISEPGALTYFPSDREKGFKPARRVSLAFDEAEGPLQVAVDPAQGYLEANLSGSGSDVVRVRNGSICYWPHLGHGRFGAKVVMENAPVFEHADYFNPTRIRFVDLSGTGTADLLYLGAEGVRYWLNESGNRFSDAHDLGAIPPLGGATSVQVADVLGEGTPCLIWSSPLPQDGGAPVRYIRLQGSVPPHLLTAVSNNMGRETRLSYRSSAADYLEAKRNGRPWHTRLPSHVTVADRVTDIDYVTGSRLVTRYVYRDGYFDGDEQSFQGFSCVDQYDTETFEAFPGLEVDDYVAPTRTRTWYHNGSANGDRPRAPGRQEDYYGDDPAAHRLPEATVEEAMQYAPDTIEEAYRALAGSVLRQEVYAADDAPQSKHPYSVTETAYRIRPLQAVEGDPDRNGHHGVFFTYASETLTHHYEQNPTDPRAAHQFVLDVDAFGVPSRQVQVAYPRRTGPHMQPEQDTRPEQDVLHATADELDAVHLTGTGRPVENAYRHSIPVETRGYELAGLQPDTSGYFSWNGLRQQVNGALQSPRSFHESIKGAASLASRQVAWERTFYYGADGDPTRTASDIVVPVRLHHAETAAFDAPLVSTTYGARVDQRLLQDLKYDLDDDYWWQPSPVQSYLDATGFFLPEKTTDPFGNDEILAYDAYHLAVTQQTDARGNRTQVATDYAALQPRRVTDPNENVQETLYDPLGHAVVTTAFGDGLDENGLVILQGDESLSAYQVQRIADSSNPAADPFNDVLTDPAAFLQGATTFAYLDLFAWKRDIDAQAPPEEARPVGTVQLTRETHVHALAEGEKSRLQMSVSYLDGFGRAVQTKMKAEPGPALVRVAVEEMAEETVVAGEGRSGEGVSSGVGVAGTRVVEKPDVQDRWLASGGTVYNNKGLPIRQYEPLFTGAPQFEGGDTFLRHGTTPVLYYDPLGRHVRTDTPKGFFSKTEFSPWVVRIFDENDTVEDSLFFSRPRDVMEPATREALAQAQQHYGTPNVAHLDALGRSFLTEERSEASGPLLQTHTTFDVQDNPVRVVDPRQRRLNASRSEANQVATFAYTIDMLGRELQSHNIDRGERWMLPDAMGRPAHHWTARDAHVETTFDALSRPAAVRVTEASSTAGAPTRTAERLIYGEDLPDPQVRVKNLLGQLAKHHDQAGTVTAERYDFRGQPLATARQVRTGYKTEADWASPVPLHAEVFRTTTTYDALGRPVRQERPDGSVHTPTYLQRGPLQQLHVTAADGRIDQRFVDDVKYNARGQRMRTRFGNGVQTARTYDADTFRLVRLVSQHQAPGGDGAPRMLQEINYTYDPVGNLTHKDDNTRGHLLANLPSGHDANRAAQYTYDALYRLTKASGWTHEALRPADHASPPGSRPPEAFKGTRHLNLNNGQALIRYTRTYDYDEAGNMREMKHVFNRRANTTTSPPTGWTRPMWVDDASNRSLPATQPGGLPRPNPGSAFDAAGNLTMMDHLDGPLRWNVRNELTRAIIIDRSEAGGDDDAEYYVYGADSMRVRKVSETVENGRVVIRETIYLSGCEVHRERRGGSLRTERWTCHIEAGDQRVALVHHWTVDAADRHPDVPHVRYQLGDHLESSALEADEQGQIISYEEYYPFGGSALIAGDNVAEVKRKTYRYSGKERDDATGLYYYGFRYYAPWLARWLKPDPAGPVDGLNLFCFVRANPMGRTDPSGTNSGLTEDFYTKHPGTDKITGIDPSFQYQREVIMEGEKYQVYEHEEHGTVYRQMTSQNFGLVWGRVRGSSDVQQSFDFEPLTLGAEESTPKRKSKSPEAPDPKREDVPKEPDPGELSNESAETVAAENEPRQTEAETRAEPPEQQEKDDGLWGLINYLEEAGNELDRLTKQKEGLMGDIMEFSVPLPVAPGLPFSAINVSGADALGAVKGASNVGIHVLKTFSFASSSLAWGMSLTVGEPTGFTTKADTDRLAVPLDNTLDELNQIRRTIEDHPLEVAGAMAESFKETASGYIQGDPYSRYKGTEFITETALGAAGPGKGASSLSMIPSGRQVKGLPRRLADSIKERVDPNYWRKKTAELTRLDLQELQSRSRNLLEKASETGERFIVKHHGEVAGREIVTVATPKGIRAFYKRTGLGTQNSAGAQPGDWSPFEGFLEKDLPAFGLSEGWFIKHKFTTGIDQKSPLFKFGSLENALTSDWIRHQGLSSGGPLYVGERSRFEIANELRSAGVRIPEPRQIIDEMLLLSKQ